MSGKRDTLGRGALDVLDALLPEQPAPAEVEAPARPRRAPAPPRSGAGGTAARPTPTRERIATARLPTALPAEVLERARRASYWTPGCTLAALVARAISREVDRMERERGEPFPERGGELKRGRPLG